MTVKTILQYDDIMSNLINDYSIDAKIRFRFLNMRKQFEPIVQNFQKVREEILKKHAETREDGTMGIFRPEIPDRTKFDSDDAYNKAVEEYNAAMTKYDVTLAEFQKDLDPILNDEANIQFTKFKVDEIMSAGLSSDALLVIIDLIEE